MQNVRRELATDAGFTLIEMLAVVVIVGILVAVAVPWYLGFTANARQQRAAAIVREAVPNAILYGHEHGSFQNMSLVTLRAYDRSLDIDHVVVSSDDQTYCLDKTVDGKTAKVTRGDAMVSGGNVVEGAGVC